jgi:hypothetical protein
VDGRVLIAQKLYVGKTRQGGNEIIPRQKTDWQGDFRECQFYRSANLERVLVVYP